MRDGPTTSQGVTILGLGALTATAVTAVPLVLYSRQERVSLSGLTGLLGFLLLFFGGLLLTFTLPRFIAPGVPVYERSALERANPGMAHIGSLHGPSGARSCSSASPCGPAGSPFPSRSEPFARRLAIATALHL